MEETNDMSKEIQLTPEQEVKKEAWLKNLADFIVIANEKTWAADGAEVAISKYDRG